ncbi:hypothetical protein JTE90_003323 [Oedothorax gibbosus]|uniref:Uncharacterized protein n=1 Tax=Oedothorax gibbosus TaxID=931172 RepID=A0AAV6UHA9_9ARAC|nr:hypothetical protein JTE90_003323 [Oedothorax gibbosus]
MSNRWFFRRQTKDQQLQRPMIPAKWQAEGSNCSSNSERSRQRGCLLPRIELTASSPTAGHVPPLSPVKNLGVPSLVMHKADSLDNIGPPIPR